MSEVPETPAAITPDPATIVPILWLPVDIPDQTPIEFERYSELAGPVPMVLPEDILTAILFVETDPGDHTRDDVRGRWEAITQHILLAGVEQIVKRLKVIRKVAHEDADAFLWWESCREQASHLFDSFPRQASETTDETAEEA